MVPFPTVVRSPLDVDPKLAASIGLAQPLAFIIWTMLLVFVETLNTWASDNPEAYTGIVSATGIVLGGVLGWWVPNAASTPPPREVTPAEAEAVVERAA